MQNYEPLRFDETCASDEDVYFDTEGEPLMLPQPYVDHALSRVDPVSADLTLLLNRTLTRELLSAPDPAGFWARNLDEDYVWTDADRGLVSPLLSAVDDLVKAGVLEIRATYDGPWFYQISAAARALAGAAEAFALRWRDPRFRVWLGALVGDWDAAYHAAYLIHRRDLMEVVLSRQDSALADPAGDRPDEAEDAPAAGDSWPGRTGE